MARGEGISPDMEQFFTSIDALFSEIKLVDSTSKKNIRSNFNFTKKQFINLLFQCTKSTVARAKAAISITLPNGELPHTRLLGPPAWLSIKEEEREKLGKCPNVEALLKALRKITLKQSCMVDGSARPVSTKAQIDRKAKSERKKVKWIKRKMDSLSPQRPQRPQREFGSHGAYTKLKKISRIRFVNREPETASEIALPLRQAPSIVSTEPLVSTEDESMSEAKDDAEQAGPVTDSCAFTKAAEEVAYTQGAQDEACSLEQFQASCDPEAFNDSKTVELITQVFSSTNRVSDMEDEMTDEDDDDDMDDRDLETRSLLDSAEHDMRGQELKAPAAATSTDILDRTTQRIAEIQGYSLEQRETFRDQILADLHSIGLVSGGATDRASLEALMDDPLSRFLEGLLIARDYVSLIPSAAWARYQKKLARFCASPRIIKMAAEERVSQMVRMIYVEEEVAIIDDDYERLDNAVLLCASLAEATGKNDLEEARKVVLLWAYKRRCANLTLRGMFERQAEVREGPR